MHEKVVRFSALRFRGVEGEAVFRSGINSSLVRVELGRSEDGDSGVFIHDGKLSGIHALE